MIRQTYLEARQEGSMTSQGVLNGDYTTILNQPLVISDGDELSLEKAFVDTIDITDNHILIDEDLTASISYYTYADMGGWGVNINVGQKQTALSFLQRSRFYSTAPNSPFTSGQDKGVLCQFKRSSYLADYEIVGVVTFRANTIAIPTFLGGNITVSYNSFDNVRRTNQYQLPEQPSKALGTNDTNTFFIGLGTNEFPQMVVSKTNPDIRVTDADSLKYNVTFVSSDGSNDFRGDTLIPTLRTKTFNIKKGRYNPEGIVNEINSSTGGIAGLQGTTPIDPSPNIQSLFKTPSSDVSDDLGPHFLTTNDFVPMGELAGTDNDRFYDRYFFVHNNGLTYQIFMYEFLNSADKGAMMGSSQGIQFEYDSLTSSINIIAMHSPLFIPASSSNTTPINLGFNYQVSYVDDGSAGADSVLTPYIINDSRNVPPLPDQGIRNTYQTDLGGVFISDLQPRSFWESLGFNVPQISANPIYKLIEDGYAVSGITGPDVTTSPMGNIDLPQFDLEITKNLTGNFVDIASIRSLSSFNNYVRAPDVNTGMDDNLGIGLNMFASSITNTFKIEADSRITGSELDSAYYLVEVDLHQNKLLDADGGEKRTIAGIINRFYSISSYTALEGGFTYIHRGEPMIINSLHIRILMPDGTLVRSLGSDNAVFLKLVTRIQEQIQNIKKPTK